MFIGVYGNLEGILVWWDDVGVLWVIMVLDDNEFLFVCGKLVEYWFG